MPNASFTAACVALAFVLSLSTGCERFLNTSGKGNLTGAEKKVQAGDFAGGVRLYEASLDGTAKSAEAHYRLAVLYADKLKRPGDAWHHLDRYLELAPSGTYAKEARSSRDEAKQRLVASLSKGNPLTQDEAARLKNKNLELTKALAELRVQKNATPPPTPAGMKKGEQVQRPVPPGARTHVVKSGETLGLIAAKYYKNKARFRDIQDANFYNLSGTAKIRPGMVLIIP